MSMPIKLAKYSANTQKLHCKGLSQARYQYFFGIEVEFK